LALRTLLFVKTKVAQLENSSLRLFYYAYTNLPQDIALLAQVTDSIRTYTTGCNHIEYIIAACAIYDLELYVGLDIEADPAQFNQQLDQLLASVALSSTPDLTKTLRGVVVGNEAVYREEVTIPTIIEWIGQTRTALAPLSTRIGRVIPVSAADIFIVYLRNQDLVDAVDFLVPNMYY
jgi:exo-beta-1,3-glucanase (GH17 family)